MRMTREEAIRILKNGGIEVCGEADRVSEFIAALDVALDDLIPPTREDELEAENRELKERIVNWRNYMAPTREQVEKVWPGCEACKDAGLAIGEVQFYGPFEGPIDVSGNMHYCPNCGRPITPVAKDRQGKRLETLKDGKGD